MRKFCFLIFCFLIVFVSYSNGKVSSKKPDYARTLNQSICRLNSHPDNQRAKKKVQDTYTQALDYYQHEIDRILMSKDSFKWTKTLGVLEEINSLSDEIIYNSEASQLICEPKIYTSEIADVTQKAIVELYEAGSICLKQHSKEKAKEAYSYFSQTSKLNSGYKDVGMKIQEAKDHATWKVIIEPVLAHTQNNVLGFSTKTFYQILFYKLREGFSSQSFVHFYTLEEAQKKKIENPDQVVQIEISNFEMIPHRYIARKHTTTQPSKKMELVNGKYVWIDVEKYNNSGPGPQVHQHEYTRLEMKSAVVLNVNSLSESKTIYKYRMTWNYFEELGYSYSSKISPTFISISPDNQIFFDRFSLSVCDQVVLRLYDFYGQYK